MKIGHLSRVFFCCSRVITRCLRLAYAVAVFSYAGTICLDLPTRAYAYQLFSDFAYTACVCCFCGLSVGLNSSHFAYAVGASVVSWGGVFVLLGIATPGCRTLPPTPPTQKKILTNILKVPTKSLRAQAKCLRQHFTSILCINWIFLLKNAAHLAFQEDKMTKNRPSSLHPFLIFGTTDLREQRPPHRWAPISRIDLGKSFFQVDEQKPS